MILLLMPLSFVYWLVNFNTGTSPILVPLSFYLFFCFGTAIPFLITIAVVIKNNRPEQQIRIDKTAQMKQNLLIIALFSMLYTILKILPYFFSTPSNDAFPSMLLIEGALRAFMMLFFIGLSQYIGCIYFKNRYLWMGEQLIILFVGVALPVGKFNSIKFAIFSFYSNKDYIGYGFSLPLTILLFVGTLLVLIYWITVALERKEYYGRNYETWNKILFSTIKEK